MSAYNWARLWRRYADVAAERCALMVLLAFEIGSNTVDPSARAVQRARRHAQHFAAATMRAAEATERHAADVVAGMEGRRR